MTVLPFKRAMKISCGEFNAQNEAIIFLKWKQAEIETKSGPKKFEKR